MQALPSHVYAVILAGGSGTRFWPKSRHLLPKQLCKIGDSEKSMIELTLNRLDGLVPPERRLIVTHRDQMQKTREIAAAHCDHFLAEPSARNTAPALALAALEIQALAPSGGRAPLMISLHADALIKDLDAFHQALRQMVDAAEDRYLTLLGVTPTYPETGYGYIEKGEAVAAGKACQKVKSFREKPNRDLAEQYLNTGRFLWNSGIFAWRIDVILEELDRYLPLVIQKLGPLLETTGVKSLAALPEKDLAAVYSDLPQIAIDPAILERSQRVAVIEADIGWKDVGSWDALDSCFPTDADGNIFYGSVTAIDCTGTTVDSDAQIVACIGLQDIVVVSSKEAILVCRKDRAQDVKKIVEMLKNEGRNQLI